MLTKLNMGAIDQILRSKTSELKHLVKLGEIDPGRDFRFADLREVDFGDIDLEGFDFYSADLTGANLVNAKHIYAANFEKAVLHKVAWPPEARRLRRYMKLAQQLGSFAGQLTETGLRAVTVTYAGQVAGLNTQPLTAALLQGLLSPWLTGVNAVNAPLVARERNIAVTTVHQEQAEGYQTLIRLAVETERGERTVAGTLFQKQRPRVIEVNGIEIEAQLGPHMLYVRHEDKAGVIDASRETLGEAGANVVTVYTGRRRPGGEAMSLIEIDQPLSEDLLMAIVALPHITQCKHLTF